MSRPICPTCGRAVVLCTCTPTGSQADEEARRKAEELKNKAIEALTAELKRASSDLEVHKNTLEKLLEAAGNHRKEHKKLVGQRDALLETVSVAHGIIIVAKNVGSRAIDWEMTLETLRESYICNGGDANNI